MKSNGPPSRSCMKSPSLRATSREAPFSSRIFLVTARVSGVSKTVRRAPGYRFAHSTAYVPGPPPRSRTRSPSRKGNHFATRPALSRACSLLPEKPHSHEGVQQDGEATGIGYDAPGQAESVGGSFGQGGKDAEIERREQDHGTLVSVGHLHEVVDRRNLHDRLLPGRGTPVRHGTRANECLP